MNIWPRRKLDAVPQAYRDARRPRRMELLDEQTLIVLDAETSGFRIETDRVLSLAALRIERGQTLIGSLRHWLVYQDKAAFNDAVAVHGILPSQTAEGRPEDEVIRELL